MKWKRRQLPLINIDEVKKKFLLSSSYQIVVTSVDEVKEMIQIIVEQQQQLEEAYKELHIANDMIKGFKKKSRIKTYLALEAENLEFAQKLHKANQEIERLLIVEESYAAYKKTH
jgi:hypothetical protein